MSHRGASVGGVGAFRVVDLTGWTRGEREPGGDEEKRWFEAPVDSEFSGRWLFKPHREKLLVLSKERAARSERPDVLVRGEDWAEKIAYELAQILHVPAVVTELAAAVRTRDGKRVRGSMSRWLSGEYPGSHFWRAAGDPIC